jgi:SCY1-like protein 1
MIGVRVYIFQDSIITNLSIYSPPDEFESAPAESGGTNAVGWRGASDDEDPWAAFEDPAPTPMPISVTELTSPPAPVTPPVSVVTPARTLAARPSRITALSPSRSPRGTPPASPAVSEPATSPVASPPSAPSTAGMTKEEKAAEMARRKEERKQVGPHFFLDSGVDNADDTPLY